MFDRIGFLLGEALSAMRRNHTMAFAAISTVAVSLFLLGAMGSLYWNLEQYARSLAGRFDMRVFLKEELPPAEVTATAAKLRALPGVKQALWIPKGRAWQKFKIENPSVNTDGIENPLPEAFKVTLGSLGDAERVETAMKALPSVEQVVYMRDELNMVDKLGQLLRWLGGVVGGVLFLTAGVLIYNAIRLAVVSRRLEVRVMQLVGASRLTVQIPFLIEGIVQGTMGGLFASVLLLSSRDALQYYLNQSFPGFATMPPFPFWSVTAVLCAFGAAYGLLCSLIAVQSISLRYRWGG